MDLIWLQKRIFIDDKFTIFALDMATNASKYIRPTLLCVIFMLAAVFYHPLWEIFGLIGLAALCVSYWGVSHMSKAKASIITTLSSQLLAVLLILSIFITSAMGLDFMMEAWIFFTFVWGLVVIVAINSVAKIVAAIALYREGRLNVGRTMIVSVFLMALFIAFTAVHIIPSEVYDGLTRLLCLAYAVEAFCIWHSFCK